MKKIKYLLFLIWRFIIDYFFYNFLTNQLKSPISIKDLIAHYIAVKPILNKFESEYDKEQIIKHANLILDHKFFLINSTYSYSNSKTSNPNIYNTINWHYDPFNKKQFSHKGWYRLVRNDVPVGSDLKFPWELSRFQHLIKLGQAFTISKNEKYALEFVNEIIDWIDSNPVRYGINWSNTMEVGIRSVNWSIAILYFIDSKYLTEKFLNRFLRSIQDHGNHIYQNLENLQSINSNHYIGDLFGLFVLSIIHPLSADGHKWFKFSKKELETEIIHQTDCNGWDYEASIPYHILVTEMFLYSHIIGEYFKQPFSSEFTAQLKKMIKVIDIVQKPDHTVPQIGDNDSGFSLAFDCNHNNLNVKNLIRLSKINNLKTFIIKKNKFFKYEEAGYYLYKNDIIYFLFTTGPKVLKGLGSHAHNDIFSFVLNVKGENILIDPGTYVYSSDPIKRNYFRSVTSHNTLFWSGIEPRNITNGLFKLNEEGKKEIESVSGSDMGFNFIGKHSYQYRDHQREISINNNDSIISIKDSVSHKGAILKFNIGQGNTPYSIKNGFMVRDIKFMFKNVNKIEIEDSFYSPSYGKIETNKSVSVSISDTKLEYNILYN